MRLAEVLRPTESKLNEIGLSDHHVVSHFDRVLECGLDTDFKTLDIRPPVDFLSLMNRQFGPHEHEQPEYLLVQIHVQYEPRPQMLKINGLNVIDLNYGLSGQIPARVLGEYRFSVPASRYNPTVLKFVRLTSAGAILFRRWDVSLPPYTPLTA